MKRQKINNPKYAVGYARYSSNNQDEMSIEAQKREIKKYADEQGLIIIKFYIDRAKTGTNDNRKEFKQMIEDSKEREFSQVLVYQLDRFARNREDHMFYKVDLRRNGVKVFSVTEKFDDTPEGQLMEAIIESITAYYSHDLARKTTRNMKENAYKGFNNGGSVPYGYKLIPRLDTNGNQTVNKRGKKLHNLAIHEERAEAVKIMFEMTLQGRKRSEIINRLNQLKYKKADGKSFVATSIDNILRNEKYTGVLIYDSNVKRRKNNSTIEPDIIRVENALPQIISKEIFDTVQKQLKQRIHKAPSIAKEIYLLSGKIFCGECGKTYIGLKQKGYLYYKCSNQQSFKNGVKQEKYCHNNAVRKNSIERFVINLAKKILLNENSIDDMLEEYNLFEKEISVNNSLIQMLENKIKENDKQKNNISQTIADGYASKTLLEKLDSLEKERDTVLDSLEKEKYGTNHIFATRQDMLNAYRKARETFENGNLEEQKIVLQSFLNKVFVFKDHVEVYFNLIPMVLCGVLDFEIRNQDVMTIWNLNPKDRLIENENGMYSVEPINKKEQSDNYPIVQLPPQDKFYGRTDGWLPR